jgi:hypothetical protein
MRQPDAAREYQRLLRGEISADTYWEALRREAGEEVRRLLERKIAPQASG